MLEEERTNALGLFNSAECYREAADILASEHAKALRFDHPVRYHFYHAIELYLKAFLRTDLPLDKVESYGHRFRRLRSACTTRGLPLEQHEREVLTIIDTDKRYIRARYLVTGPSQEVAIKDLSWAAAAIAQKGRSATSTAWSSDPTHRPIAVSSNLRQPFQVVAFNAAPLQAVTGPKCASTAGNISGLSPQLLGYVQTGNVMAKNLLPCLPDLTKDECNEIVYAVSYFSSRYRTNPPPYDDREALAILDPEEVIKAQRRKSKILEGLLEKTKCVAVERCKKHLNLAYPEKFQHEQCWKG